MHQISHSAPLLLALLVGAPVLSAKQVPLISTFNDQMAGATKTLKNESLGAEEGFEARVAQKPILSILHAFLGYDQMESAGLAYTQRSGGAQPSLIQETQPITEERAKGSYKDVTMTLQSALKKAKGKVYVTRSGGAIVGLKAPLKSNPSADVTRYALRASESSTGESFLQSSTPDSLLSQDDRTVGIVYQDTDGIHFRRFEGWQNIALPMLSSCKVGPWDTTPCCNGAFFYAHQLEETGRGLVTATVKGTIPLNFLATDRFGWNNTFHDGTTFCAGAYMPIQGIGQDMYLLHKGPSNRWFGNPSSLNLFRFQWGKQESVLDCKEGGFATHPHFALPHLLYAASTPTYTYYDENGQKQSIKMPGGNADPSLNFKQPGCLIFPGTLAQPIDVWFAFDRTPSGMKFMLGTGTPQNEDDITSGAHNTRLLYQKNIITSPYLRNFAFSADDATGFVYNIESRFLNPKKKFCCPPFCKGKFLFWRKEWEVETPDSFSVIFRARGKSLHIGLSSLAFEDRFREDLFSCDYDYAIRIDDTGAVRIEKYDGDQTPTTQQLPVTLRSPFTADAETYTDYWISYANGFISIGTGLVPGQATIGEAFDDMPTRNIKSFCFSSDVRTTDYIGIAPLTESALSSIVQQRSAVPGTYSVWPQTQRFATRGRGAFVLSYKYEQSAESASEPLVMAGLAPAAPKNGSTSSVPYQIFFGTQNNSSAEIVFNGNTVATSTPGKVGAPPLISADGAWHDLWVAFDNGLIVCGTGSTLGQNIQCSWQDPSTTGMSFSTMKTISIFSLSTMNSGISLRMNRVINIPDQRQLNAAKNGLPVTQPLWAMTQGDQGFITFSAIAAPQATLQVAVLDQNTPLSKPLCEFVINDQDKKAYVRKNRTPQAESVTLLSPAQRPSSAGTTYWCGWSHGQFILGTGKNPVDDLSSPIFTWQDPAPPKNMFRFALSAAGASAFFRNIAVLPFEPYASLFKQSSLVAPTASA